MVVSRTQTGPNTALLLCACFYWCARLRIVFSLCIVNQGLNYVTTRIGWEESKLKV